LECFRSIRRLSRVEEQLKQKRDETIVEAQAIVGVDQVAGLKRLIDSLESQLSYYHRLISDLEGNVNDLRSQVMELERRVREREKVRGVPRERSLAGELK
jgi:chromosome segregation ATPase